MYIYWVHYFFLFIRFVSTFNLLDGSLECINSTLSDLYHTCNFKLGNY
jgi:hypothetical protein